MTNKIKLFIANSKDQPISKVFRGTIHVSDEYTTTYYMSILVSFMLSRQEHEIIDIVKKIILLSPAKIYYVGPSGLYVSSCDSHERTYSELNRSDIYYDQIISPSIWCGSSEPILGNISIKKSGIDSPWMSRLEVVSFIKDCNILPITKLTIRDIFRDIECIYD